MRKSVFVLAAFALAACSTREESYGEVVDTTIDNSKAVLEMDSTLRDTVAFPTIGTDTNLKKPVGRKPVDMKDSLRRP
jgi:hypothetical protein